ncbi:hypothetical protein FPZ42_08440 [Mucilaginibacter achroorhodeus]|uniref:Outer membrane protein beta-barrel domain-containing protein n=1 Tax=Mucilaginibacter achroorhodeus TaxID=2599294 RepID=A0A563U6S0_9SPHI|nr:hypothetical protein [Mucilaginibacter achroorhodeus]TWR27051.1 hypothetical protein FPZ42_08440 [Mucilaginibacter achroorhodeus]
MKKLFFVLAIIAGTAFTASAQSSSSGHFSIGFDGGFPVGSSSDVYSVVLGGNLKYEQPIASATYFTVSAGYSSLKVKDVFGGGSLGYVPLKAGIKYYFNGAGFYGEGQLGAAISTESGGGTAFAYSPGIGYTIDGGFDLGVRYEGWSKNGTFSQIGFRVGYNF